MNKIVEINTLAGFHDAWPFLESGFEVLTRSNGGRLQITPKAFQRTLINATAGSEYGGLLLLTNKNDLPLGYICLVATSTVLSPKTLSIFALYSTEKCPSAYEELVHEAKIWARMHRYEKLRFECHRITGAAAKFAEKKLHLSPEMFIFSTDV